MPGLPFDDRRGVISNVDGRVVDASGIQLPGLYTSGWIKRGPTGIIGTNRACSVDTVTRLIEDLPLLDEDKPGRSALTDHLDRHKHRYISFSNWLNIEQFELGRGRERNKVAEKLVNVSEMLEAAASIESAVA